MQAGPEVRQARATGSDGTGLYVRSRRGPQRISPESRRFFVWRMFPALDA
jgi:hypothetical protein